MLNKELLEVKISTAVSDVVNMLDLSENEHASKLLEIAPGITNFHFLNGWSGWSDGEEYPISYCSFGAIVQNDVDQLDDEFISYCYKQSKEISELYAVCGLPTHEVEKMINAVELTTDGNVGSQTCKLPFSDSDISALAKLYTKDITSFYEYVIISGMLADDILMDVDDIIPLHKWYTIQLD